MTYEAKLEKNGKITLPKAVIQELGIKQGDIVIFWVAECGGKTYYYLTTHINELGRFIEIREEPTPP